MSMTDEQVIVALAEKVMDWKTIRHDSTGQLCGFMMLPDGKVNYRFDPLTSIADAWMVMEKMREKRFSPTFQWPSNRAPFSASFLGLNGEYACEWDANAPRAICLAALKAVGAKL